MISNPNNPVWKDYVWQMIPVGIREAANVRAGQTGNFFASDEDEKTWDEAKELRPETPGSGPATHLLIGTLVRHKAGDVVGVDDAIATDDLPQSKVDLSGSDYWRESEGWTYESVIADAKMQEIPGEEI